MKTVQQAEIRQANNHAIEVQGVLDFATVPTLIKTVEKVLKQAEAGTVFKLDLAEVSSSNSAGVAFLLELNRLCRLSEQSLKIRHMPQPMQTIARAHGVDEVLDALA